MRFFSAEICVAVAVTGASAARAPPSAAVRGAGVAVAATNGQSDGLMFLHIGDGLCVNDHDYTYASAILSNNGEFGNIFSCMSECNNLNNVDDPIVGLQWDQDDCWCLYTNERTSGNPGDGNCPSSSLACIRPSNRATGAVRRSDPTKPWWSPGVSECWAMGDGNRFSDLEQTNAGLVADLSRLEGNNAELVGEKEVLDNRISDLEQTNAGLVADLLRLEGNNAELVGEKEVLETRHNRCTNRREELNRQLSGTNDFIRGQDAQILTITANNTALATELAKCDCPKRLSADVTTARAAL